MVNGNGKDSEGGSGIHKGPDGVYRWQYDMSMWKNPTILITLFKVFLFSASIPVLLVTFLVAVEQGIADGMAVFGKVALIVYGIVVVLMIISYSVLTMVYGGRYQVVFEMDEKGIKHIQMQKQFEKSQVLSMLAVLAGVAAGNPTTTAAGLLAGTRNSCDSRFKDVRKIISKPSRNVIYVSELLEKNQVYIGDEDFDFVETYIISHCSKAAVRT